MPLLIRPTFDAGTAEADFNKWMANLAKGANLPVKPQFVPPTGGAGSGDPMKPLQDGATKAGQQIETLQAQLGKLFEKADFQGGNESMEQLRARAEKAQEEFARARIAVQQFSEDIAGIDFTNANPQRAKVLADEMKRLGDTAKNAFSDASAATKEYERAMEKAEKATSEVTSAAERTAKASEEMLNLDLIGKGVGAIGDLKDILEKAGTAVFGFSKQTTDAIVMTGDLTEKGAALGGVFGPMGAIIVGVTGGLLGYITATKQAAEAARQHAAAEKLKNAELSKGLSDVATSLQSLAIAEGLDVFGLSNKSIDALESNLNFLNDKIKLKAEEALVASKNLADISKRRGTGDTEVAKAKADSDEMTRALAALRLERTETQKAIDEYNKSLEATAATTDIVAEKIGKNPVGRAVSSLPKAKKTSAPAGLSSGEDSLLDVAGMREAREEVNALTESMLLLEKATSFSGNEDPGGSLIGRLGRDLVYAQEAAQGLEIKLGAALEELDADTVSLLQDVDPLRGAIQDLFGIWTQEGTAADLVMDRLSESLHRVGGAAAGAIGGAATSAFGALFDAMAKNQEMLEPFGKAFQRKAAEALRGTGSELIGDGVANLLKAGAMAFIPGLQGNAVGLATMGAAEVTTGLAMGGVGIGLGRRAGAAPAESAQGDRGAGGSVGPSRSGGDSGPKVQAPIVINMSGVPFGIMTEREQTEIGQRISQSLNTFHANGGPSFPV